MADFTEIIQEINTNLPDNTTQAITAAKLRTTLIDLTNAIDNQQDDFESSINDEVDNLISQAEEATNNFQNTIVDNLESTASDAALSANQGRILNESIFGKVDKSEMVDLRQYLPATMTTGDYINSSGQKKNSSSYASKGVTGYIPVSGLTGVLIFDYCKNTSAVVGCATYEDTVESSFVSRFTSSTYPDYTKVYFFMNDSRRNANVNYVRFTIGNVSSLDDVSIYIVGKDQLDTPIYDYTATDISKDTTIDTNDNLFFTKVVGPNLFDKSTAVLGTGLYLNSSGGFSTSGSSTYGVSGFIPFGDKKILWITRRYDTLPTSRSICTYDANFNLVRGIAAGQPYIVQQEGEVYARFTMTSNADNFMVSGYDYADYLASGWTTPAYQEQLKLNPDLMSTVGIDNIDKTEWKYGSANVCNPDECIWDNTKYIGYSTGRVISTTSSSSRIGVTGFLPITKNGLYFGQMYTNYDAIGGAIYDKDFKYIRGTTSGTISWQEGYAWARFTIGANTTPENIIANEGTSALDEYVAWGGKTKVISKEILPAFVEDSGAPSWYDGVKVDLPTKIYVTAGDRLQIFWKNCVKAFDPYVFNVFGVSSVGLSYPRYFQYDCPSSATGQTYSLRVYIRDNNGNILDSKSTTIVTVPKPTSISGNKNVVIVGASATASGNIIHELNKRICTTNGSGTYYDPTGLGLTGITWCGSTTPLPSEPSLKQEAHSGWAWSDYATVGRNRYRFYVENQTDIQLSEGATYKISGAGSRVYTIVEINITDGNGYYSCTYNSGSAGTISQPGTMTKQSGDGDSTINFSSYEVDSSNKFWNNGALDFQNYANTYCTNGNTIDIMITHLGVNDIFGTGDASYTIENYVKPFLRAFHTQMPNGKFIISTLPMPSPFGGMTKSYGATFNNEYWSKAKIFWEYADAFDELGKDSEFSSFLTISTPMHTFDSEHLYPTNTVRVCNRSELTETVQTNGVHPIANGSYTVADDIYHSMCKILN